MSSPVANTRRLTPTGSAVLWAVLLVLLVAAVFGPAARYAFTNFDEKTQALDNPLVRSLAPVNLLAILSHYSITSYYPVRLLSFAIDHAIWGERAGGYHLTNIAIHAINIVLAYALAVRLLRVKSLSQDPCGTGVSPISVRGLRPGGKGETSGQRRGLQACAALAAAAAAVHPVVVEPSAWIAGREELLTAFFVLITLHAHFTSSAVEAARASRAPHPWRWQTLAWIAGAGACFSNVTGAVVPLLTAALDRLALRLGGRQTLRRSALLCVPAAVAIVLKLHEPGRDPTATPWLQDVATGVGIRLSTVLHVFALNLRTLVWPHNLIVIYSHGVPAPPVSPSVVAGAVLLIGVIVLLWVVRRSRVAMFSIAAFLAALAPSAQLIPHYNLRADRFLYVPLLMLTPALAAGLNGLTSSRRRWFAVAPAMLVLLAVLAAASMRQLPVWQNSLTLFTQCLQHNPAEPRAHNNRGLALADLGDHEAAMVEFTRAGQLASHRSEPFYNLGSSLLALGRWQEAADAFTTALRCNPSDGPSFAGRGRALAELGRLNEAVDDFTAAMQLEPDDPAHQVDRADAFVRSDQLARAIGDYTAVVTRWPRYAEAYCSRGAALLRLDRIDEALADFDRAVAIAPDDARARLNRGVALARLGRMQEAWQEWQRAAELDPQGHIGDEARANLCLLDRAARSRPQ